MDETTQKGGAQTPPPLAGQPKTPPEKNVVVAGAHSNAALRVGDLGEGKRRTPAQSLLAAFLPNRAVSPMTMRLIVAVELAAALAIWLLSPFKVLPRPDE